MTIKTINKKYNDIATTRTDENIETLNENTLRAFIADIIDLQYEIINKIGDMRLSNSTCDKLDYIYADLSVIKAEYYIALCKLLRVDYSKWVDIIEESKTERSEALKRCIY